ncbi:MAG: phosphate butyryltransferase [Mycoplasma sp.]|nr:phosphate butyryltransferase [Mycoplasma sp.]
MFDLKKIKPNKTIAIVNGHDENIIKSLSRIPKTVSFRLYGDQNLINQNLDIYNVDRSNLAIINCLQYEELSQTINNDFLNKKFDVLMKGAISTKDLLLIILNKENQLFDRSNLLSHIAAIKLDTYKKLLWITDGAINISPNQEHKVKIMENAIKSLSNFGYNHINIGLISAVEKVNPKMQSTVDADSIVKAFKRDNVIIEGPLALDNVLSKEATLIKGIDSKIAGEVDLLVMPNIESGNILYKAINYLIPNSQSAGIVLGAKMPIILTSRADNEQTKFNSIILGLLV